MAPRNEKSGARATRKTAGKTVSKVAPKTAPAFVGKRIKFDPETWDAVALLARDQMKDLDEITEEAFRDLLKKHGRTADWREALRLSAKHRKVRR
jgi:hypothetical protein